MFLQLSVTATGYGRGRARQCAKKSPRSIRPQHPARQLKATCIALLGPRPDGAQLRLPTLQATPHASTARRMCPVSLRATGSAAHVRIEIHKSGVTDFACPEAIVCPSRWRADPRKKALDPTIERSVGLGRTSRERRRRRTCGELKPPRPTKPAPPSARYRLERRSDRSSATPSPIPHGPEHPIRCPARSQLNGVQTGTAVLSRSHSLHSDCPPAVWRLVLALLETRPAASRNNCDTNAT